MPTYQYACTNTECGNEFELVQSFTDPAASECPTCHGPVRKVFSAVGVVFKGSGFYRTDSRAGNGNGKASSGSSANGKAKDSGQTTSESSASSSASDSGSSSGTSSSSAPAARSSAASSAPTSAA